MRKFITSNAFLTSAGIAAIFVLWFLVSLSLGPNNLVFPTPVETFKALGGLLSASYIYACLGFSLLHTLQGFALSFALALLLGSLAGEIKPLQRFFKPLILVAKSAPTAAFVFLFLLLSGSTMAPVYVVTLLAFPILYESVVAGINAIPKEILFASRVDAAGKFRTLLRIKIPLAFPYVLLGIINSFALSFKTEIMAEIVTGSTGLGLGGAIRGYRNLDPSDLTPIFAITLLAIIAVLLFDLASFFLIKRFGKR